MNKPIFDISGVVKREHMEGDIRVIDELKILSVDLCAPKEEEKDE